jgi:hypothetical protein
MTDDLIAELILSREELGDLYRDVYRPSRSTGKR